MSRAKKPDNPQRRKRDTPKRTVEDAPPSTKGAQAPDSDMTPQAKQYERPDAQEIAEALLGRLGKPHATSDSPDDDDDQAKGFDIESAVRRAMARVQKRQKSFSGGQSN